MKINEIPEEHKSHVKFACLVCRNKFEACTGRKTDCAWKVCGGEICDFVVKAIHQTNNEKLSMNDVCVAYGAYAGEGRQICKNCEDMTNANKQ